MECGPASGPPRKRIVRMNVLDQIVAQKRREVETRRRARPLETLLAAPAPPLRDFAGALRGPGLAAICEIKRRSPSRGTLRAGLDPAAVARDYAQHGAAAISVLTDTEFFGGCDEDLRRARDAVAVPVLRKDFTIDEYQVHEARRLGADAILLIVRILSDAQLVRLGALAEKLGLAALVEAHDETEVRRAVDGGARIVGVNSRDLDTFEVDLQRALRLRPHIPESCLTVAESGIHDRGDVQRLAAAGFDAMLVGEALMRAEEPGRRLAELLGATS